MKRSGLFLLLLLAASERSQAASTYASPPLKLSQFNSVRLAPDVFRLGDKLRVRNLSSGNSIVIDLDPSQPYLAASVLSRIVASSEVEWLPEFSVLGGDSAVPSSAVAVDLPPALRVKANVIESRQLLNQSFPQRSWRVLGYRVLRASNGSFFLEVSNAVRTIFVSPEQAARRIEIREKSNLAKLFDLGWRSLSIQRYDLGLEAFQRIFKRKEHLDEKQNAQAHLGVAVSMYHIEGCTPPLDDHLVEADRDPANQDDVSYYRALCAMAHEHYDQAEVLFKKLVEKQHQNYSEASAFYLGVIAENDERYDDAEAAYLDTIDFAADATLASIAKTRLENVRVLKAQASLETKWISGGLSAGATYDNNVIALPAELTPASYGLSRQSALLTTDIAFLNFAPPWSRSITHKINYTFLMNKHFDKAIASSYDSHVQDVGTQLGFKTSPDQAHNFSYSWTSIALKPLGSSKESLRTQTASYSMKFLRGNNPEQPDSELEWTYRFTAIRPTQAPASSSTNLSANGHLLSVKYLQRRNFPHVYGPEFSAEQRNSKGSENSLWDVKAGASWDYYFGETSSPWYISQNGAFNYKPYFDSLENRHDYALSYVASLGKTWGSSLDTRLQVQGIYNFSTLRDTYQYRQASVSLLVTAFF
ncbi:MAG: tetratricopeptide repeat protein [Bdellovibrionota bacterium]